MDEAQKIILEIENAEKLEKLNAAYAENIVKLKELLDLQKQHPFAVNQSEIDRLATSAAQLKRDIDNLTGEKTAGGRGILGASYALQDFASQANNSMGAALGSMSNNIPQMLELLGPGAAGLAGGLSALTAVAAAVLVSFEKTWKEIAKGTDHFLKEQLTKIKKAQDAFDKLSQTPTDTQKESAEGFKYLLGERPVGDEVIRLLKDQMGAGAAEQLLKPSERARLDVARKTVQTDPQKLTEEILNRLNMQRGMLTESGEMVPPDAAMKADAARQAQQAISRSKGEIAGLTNEGKKRLGKEMLRQAQEDQGPAGDRSRQAIVSATRGTSMGPGFESIMPEAIKAANKEVNDQIDQAAARTESWELQRDKAKRDKKILDDTEKNMAELAKTRTQVMKEDDDKKKRAEKEAEHFRKENYHKFSGFDQLPGAGTMSPTQDEIARRWAMTPRGAKPAFARQLQQGAYGGLMEQNPLMERPEAVRRAAQYPAYIQQRAQNLQQGGDGRMVGEQLKQTAGLMERGNKLEEQLNGGSNAMHAAAQRRVDMLEGQLKAQRKATKQRSTPPGNGN